MGKRLQRVNSVIEQELGKIIFQEINLPKGCLVTVTSVDTSPDLEHAKIRVSIMPKENQKRVMDILQKNIYRLQKLLNKKLIMRYVPKIEFIQDKTQERVDTIEKILKEIKK